MPALHTPTNCSLPHQTEAAAAAKAADVRIKHLQKQLGEQQKQLASKQKEGSKLGADLERERGAVEQCRSACRHVCLYLLCLVWACGCWRQGWGGSPCAVVTNVRRE